MNNYKVRLTGLLLASVLIVVTVLAGNNKAFLTNNTENEQSISESTSENYNSLGGEKSGKEEARSALLEFMNGDLEDHAQLRLARDSGAFDCKYIFLDLDGDNVDELIIRDKDAPGACTFVFNYENGNIDCWLYDTVEETSVDYPLSNSMMVSEYRYGGMTTSKVYRFLTNGEQEYIKTFSVLTENIYGDPSIKCPGYEIDDIEVDEKGYNEGFKTYVGNHMIPESEWTAYGNGK